MKEWYSPNTLAGLKLKGLKVTPRTIRRTAENEGWRAAQNLGGEPLARRADDGGWEYHYTLLPGEAQADLLRRHLKAQAAKETVETPQERPANWADFDTLPADRKRKAQDRLDALNAMLALEKGGLSRTLAVAQVARDKGLGKNTLWGWLRLTAGLDKKDWLPALAPKWKGRSKTADCHPDAWDILVADYLRQSRPPFSSCYARLKAIADERGWHIPSERTLYRRIQKEVPGAVHTLKREGAEAASRLYPAMERDRTHFHALQVVNADFHKLDIFVRFPDGQSYRPQVVAIQDLYSNKILAWRVDVSANATAVRLAFYDVFRNYGVPEKAYLDNGREFAAKSITGGQPTRYRFKVRHDETPGILTQLGCDVRWTRPHSGQSKPIERAFRDWCDNIAKHPAFEGAYIGNKPGARPENAGTRTVEFDTFLQVMEQEVRAHNAKPGRNTRVCGRELSFDQAFERSYADALIRKASDEQLRLVMLAAESVTARKPDGAVHLYGNRYWAEFLVEQMGRKVTVRLDPDDLHSGAHVYNAAGAYLGFAECWTAGAFDSLDGARRHAANRKKYQRGLRELAELAVRLKPEDVAAAQPYIEEAPRPETRTVRMVHGATAMAVRTREEIDEAEERDLDFADSFSKGLQLVSVNNGLSGEE